MCPLFMNSMPPAPPKQGGPFFICIFAAAFKKDPDLLCPITHETFPAWMPWHWYTGLITPSSAAHALPARAGIPMRSSVLPIRLFDLMQKEKPTHMAVVWDTHAPTERHTDFTDYKANRWKLRKICWMLFRISSVL